MEKEFSYLGVSNNSILLVCPPGWSLNPGGPHLSLPLLKGFLEAHYINTELRDLNIEVSNYYNLRITESSVLKSCQTLSLDNLNTDYLLTQDKMNLIAAKFNGCWDIISGFNFNDCDLSSSESIRQYSQEVSPFREYYNGHFIPYVLKNTPVMIGISITVPAQLLSAFEISRLLRNAGYNGYIFFGGNIITRLADELRLAWIFDIVNGLIIYQGEQTLKEIYQAIKCNDNFGKIPNMIWKKDNQIISNRVIILNPKAFCEPDFGGLKLYDYWGINYLPLVGSRGCYYGKCTFCSIPFGWGNNGFIGNGNPENVFETMKTYYNLYGINRFKFVEEAMHPAFISKLAERINKNNFPCRYEGYARLDPFWKKKNVLKKVAKSGLKKVYLGLELAPSDTRANLHKSDSQEPLEILLRFKDAGIKTHIFCLFGYPGTGTNEALSTIEFALKYQDLIDSLDIFPFYYAKHTQVKLIKPVIHPEKDWALEYDYIPLSNQVLSQTEVSILVNQLELVIWKHKPEWLHPIYRMYSPWNFDTGS